MIPRRRQTRHPIDHALAYFHEQKTSPGYRAASSLNAKGPGSNPLALAHHFCATKTFELDNRNRTRRNAHDADHEERDNSGGNHLVERFRQECLVTLFLAIPVQNNARRKQNGRDHETRKAARVNQEDRVEEANDANTAVERQFAARARTSS